MEGLIDCGNGSHVRQHPYMLLVFAVVALAVVSWLVNDRIHRGESE